MCASAVEVAGGTFQEYGAEFYCEEAQLHSLRERTYTLEAIKAFPGLRPALVQSLRTDLEKLVEQADDAEGEPHPADLTDDELVTRWLEGDENEDVVYGDPDVPYEEPWENVIASSFPNLTCGCDNTIAAKVELATADPTVRHGVLAAAVPDWARFVAHANAFRRIAARLDVADKLADLSEWESLPEPPPLAPHPE